jgi:DNA-directed RNA polymerase
MWVADQVWNKLAEKEKEIPNKYKGKLDEILVKEKEFKDKIAQTKDQPELSNQLYKQYTEWLHNNRTAREYAAIEFWNKVTDKKVRRKCVKRSVMVLGYGGTRYGYSQFLMEDLDDISEHLDRRTPLFCAIMGSIIYDTCYEKMEGPGRMLKLFEEIGEISNNRKEYLSWVTPVGFPVIQSYPKATLKRTKLTYGNKTFQVNVEAWEEATLAESSQKQATAPNFVHSLDATHLQLVVNNAEFNIAAIHDSLGCVPADYNSLYELIRECFVSLYKTNPLEDFLEQVKYPKKVFKGTWKEESVLDSKYFFS